MEASLRFLNPLTSTGRIINQRKFLSSTLFSGRTILPSTNRAQFSAIDGKINCLNRVRSSLLFRLTDFKSLGHLLGALSSAAFNSHHQDSPESFNFFKLDPNADPLRGRWNGGFDPVDREATFNGGGNRRPVMAVLLGWLGAETKHLKRYAEIYCSRGINTLRFVVPFSEVLWSDFGRKIERRIEVLANEIITWMEEKDSQERCLVFHTFSNTGWLVYGAILGHLQGKPELLGRIRGCIVDSGPEPELNPQVWAAGFATALLKKRSSAVYPSGDAGEGSPNSTVSKPQPKDPQLTETMLLVVLENFFSFIFKLPKINQRLAKAIANVSKNSPSCPQLYLYSTADKVIPFDSVERFIEQQRGIGRKVWSFNFQSSPHVDHFRAFPDLYSSKICCFLDECLVTVKQI
ncbi:hypothetical protein V2J09_009034 [Rumex salicifolius]